MLSRYTCYLATQVYMYRMHWLSQHPGMYVRTRDTIFFKFSYPLHVHVIQIKEISKSTTQKNLINLLNDV